jgi:hypothetical protein
MLKFFLATGVGAFALFLWGAMTLVLIPWHDQVLLEVADEAAVLDTLQEVAPAGGVYSVPVVHEDYTATSPFAVIAWRPGGFGMGQGTVMLASLLGYWLAAIVVGWLLSWTRNLSYGQRVLFVAGLGAFASLAVHFQNWVWTGYSVGYTAMATVDVMVGWLLAGLILAWFIPDQKVRS